jgi:hypothetical protein
MNVVYDRDILPWVTNPTNVLHIIEHAHNSQIMSDSRGFHFYDEKEDKIIRLRGLLNPLAEVFWPTQFLPYAMRDRKTKVKRNGGSMKKKKKPSTGHPRFRPLTVPDRQRESAAPVSSTSNTGRSRAQHAARGLLRGNIIHNQIEDLLLLDAEQFNRKYKQGVHTWSYNALRALLQGSQKGSPRTSLSENRPFAAEVPVAALDLGIATRIDLCSVTRGGRVLFIEVKSGYETAQEWEGATEWMQGPLHGVLVNSAKNRAAVQVMVGALMAVRSRNIVGRFECWVLHVSSAGTEFIKIHPDFIRIHGMVILNALYEHQQALRKLKQKKK